MSRSRSALAVVVKLAKLAEDQARLELASALGELEAQSRRASVFRDAVAKSHGDMNADDSGTSPTLVTPLYVEDLKTELEYQRGQCDRVRTNYDRSVAQYLDAHNSHSLVAKALETRRQREKLERERRDLAQVLEISLALRQPRGGGHAEH